MLIWLRRGSRGRLWWRLQAVGDGRRWLGLPPLLLQELLMGHMHLLLLLLGLLLLLLWLKVLELRLRGGMRWYCCLDSRVRIVYGRVWMVREAILRRWNWLGLLHGHERGGRSSNFISRVGARQSIGWLWCGVSLLEHSIWHGWRGRGSRLSYMLKGVVVLQVWRH